MSAHPLPNLDQLADLFVLESVKGFGPQKFKELHEAGVGAGDLLRAPRELQRFGKRGREFQAQLEGMGREGRQAALARAKRQISVAGECGGAILTYDDRRYPSTLYQSNMPVPVLYARGDLAVLRAARSVACVGSRNIRPPYDELHNDFSRRAVHLGFAIVSGFATGADIIGHLAAEREGGQTICVMPSGLDRPFPPEHKDIWRRFTSSSGVVFVSEFGFGVGANALNLRKRNKMIAGLATGVLVSQSAEDGGAMNAFRFAVEQKKPVATFQPDGTKETSGNDLIATSAERVRSTVLDLHGGQGWTDWLRTL